MPLDGTLDEIETDFETLEAVGGHVERIIGEILGRGAIQKTLRRWIEGHVSPPEDESEQACLMALAADLELFTPSPSGQTLVSRHVAAAKPGTAIERRAVQALAAARLRLVRIVGRDGLDLVRLKDLATGEVLELLDSRIADEAQGLATTMRLCPLPSGRQVLISPLFAMDEAMLARAATFLRDGRLSGGGHRLAVNLYRDVARGGFLPIPEQSADADEILRVLRGVADEATPVQRLAMRWIAEGWPEETPDLVGEARRLANVDDLVDACGLAASAGEDGAEAPRAVLERIAELQIQTMAGRVRAGLGGGVDRLDEAAAAIAGYVASGTMDARAREVFARLRARCAVAAGPTRGAPPAELDRVIQRIQALRAKTVDCGATEPEAMAAAAKVAELLARYDLTLDEVGVRESPCEGFGVDTGRKRRAPVDACMEPLAEFCDCRVWIETGADGALRYILFGLRADVVAARFLQELVEVTFETESATFKIGQIYLDLRGGDRRTALNSFQVGLARGVTSKLAALKTARQNATKTTGFDLVAVKHSVVDEEIDRLALNFTTRTAAARRLVHGEAYQAGRAAGALFEPHSALAG